MPGDAPVAAGAQPAAPPPAAPPWPAREIARRLRDLRGFVFDVDGTLVLTDRANHGYTVLPGAVEVIDVLTSRGVPFVLFTNGTNRTGRHYARALREVGLALGDDAVLTPATSAADVFARRGHQRVMALGNEGVAAPLREAGIEVVPPVRGERADAVLVGWYREFTMDTLEAACDAVWAGAALYSCSESVFFATREGRALGTSRAISAMIRSVTGCRMEVVGKPSRHALGAAARRLGLRPSQLAVVGDDPDLEAPMARRGGALAIAVGTGIGTPESFARLPERRGPHLMLPGVGELRALYTAAVEGHFGARPAGGTAGSGCATSR